MTWLFQFSIRRPRTVVGLAALVILAVAPGALRLQIRTDGRTLVPRDEPEVLFDQAVREQFAVEDPIVVLLRSDHPNGVYDIETLGLVDKLTTRFETIPGVNDWNLSSLATERRDRVYPGTLEFRKFLEPFPETQEDLDLIRSDVRAIGLFTGTLVSDDERATAIYIDVPAGVDRIEFYKKIEQLTSETAPPGRVRIIGAPVAEALLGTHILQDLGIQPGWLGHPSPPSDASSPRFPRSPHELRLLVARHIGLLPAAFALMAAVFLISFRSVTAALLPLSEGFACLVFVFGLMGWLGIPVYLTLAVLPIILMGTGLADEIHIFNRYRRNLRARRGDDATSVLRATLSEMWVPVMKTSVTTSIGFLSFALSPIAPVRTFGLLMAVGIVFCMLWSFTVIPALLALIRPERFVRPSSKTLLPTQGPWERDSIFRRLRVGVFVVAGLVALATPLGVSRLIVQDSWIEGFAPQSEFFRATQEFNEQFLGTHILLVRADAGHRVITGEIEAAALGHRYVHLPAEKLTVPEQLLGQRLRITLADDRAATTVVPDGNRAQETSRALPSQTAWTAPIESIEREDERLVVGVPPGSGSPVLTLRPGPDDRLRFEVVSEPMKQPATLEQIENLEAFISQQSDLAVGGVLGPASYLSTASFMAQARRQGSRSLPRTRKRLSWLWEQYERIRGSERRRQLVDPHYARVLITVYLKNANFLDTARLMGRLREYEGNELTPAGIELDFAGDVAVSQTLVRAIVKTQLISLLLSLVGIFAVTAATSRSLCWGGLCVLPCALSVLISLAAMGALGIPLGVATSMFAAMNLGIGVDFAIHLLERYRRSRAKGLTPRGAIDDALAATGPAIRIDATAVALGFGILTLSLVPANARLGGLVLLSTAGCLAGTLFLLPALLSVFPRYPQRSSSRA